jgi:spermidine synthase
MGKWEGSDATVTVVRDSRDDVSIRINSNYSLGSRGAYGSQMFQARIPLLAWPASDSVFFLGMGTGITAGEALSRNDFPKVEKVVACELSPNASPPPGNTSPTAPTAPTSPTASTRIPAPRL